MAKIKGNNLIEGKVQGNARGYAFLICTDTTRADCFIPARGLHGAKHGDLVVCKPIKYNGGDRVEVEVVKILQRGITQLVGTFTAYKGGGFVIPDDDKYSNDIFVEKCNVKGATQDDKVVVEITFYPKDKKNPEGKVVEILGKANDRLTETACILRTNGIEKAFKKAVIAEAERVCKPVTEKEKLGRKDFTNDMVITIDGESAKDFDDAINVTRLKNGNYQLSVHIADVSHYVKLGGELDKSAFSRGTSTYFPEEVIPMLPKALSDDVCSLKEGVERLTLSCIMEIDGSGDIVNKEIVKGVIKSKARMTYTKVYKILQGDKELNNVYAFLRPMLDDAYSLYAILKDKRNRRGSVNLDVKEAEISVQNGQVNVELFNRNYAHQLIEEFMIIANECVAEYAFFLDLPFIYRVHERPSVEKMANLMAFLNELDVKVKWKQESVRPSDYSAVLKRFEGSEIYPLVNRVILRSMQKAKYQVEDVGHFGLASTHYCHFTSPIRRYPDLMIHRILKEIIDGKWDILQDKYAHVVENSATNSSIKERASEQAERTVDDYYKMLYLQDKIGQVFTGIVSGVTSFGVFVELPNTVEGLIKVDTLPKGTYAFDEKNLRLFSGKYEFRLGKAVDIAVAGVDLGSKKAEFVLIDGKECCKKNKKGIQ